MERWARINYQPCLPLGDNNSRITGCKRHIELSRKAAQEGIVLLKNERNILPLKKGSKVAVFGKAQIEVMNTESAQENTQQTCRQLRLCFSAHGVCRSRIGGASASSANNGTGSGLVAAVGAKTVAHSFLEAALLASNCLGGQLFSAILTKHEYVPAFSSV